MSETSPKPRPTQEYQIGDRVPMPEKKIVVRPASWKGEGPKSLRGAFMNGRGK